MFLVKQCLVWLQNRANCPCNLNFNRMKRSGTADLPLHYGHVPRWLAQRMTRLGGAIIEAIILEYGKREVLRRISDPFWFQSPGVCDGHGLA